RYAAGGIGDRNRTDGQAAARSSAGRANAAFEINRGGAKPSADASQGELGARRFRSFVPKLAIRRVAPPILVAARQQVEQNCRRHDRHARLANLEAATLLAQPRLSARGGVEAEGGSAGQHDGVNSFHGLCRIEESSLARAGPATAHVY